MHEWVNTQWDDWSWTLVGFPILVGAGLVYIPFLRHYRGRTAWLFMLAGAIYGGGALGVEHYTLSGVNTLHYNMLTTVEEGMEMLGVIVMIYGLLDHMRREQGECSTVEFEFQSRE